MATEVVKIINNSLVDLQTKKVLRDVVDALVIEAGGVTSVNGEVGVVVLTAADVGAPTIGELTNVDNMANIALLTAETAANDLLNHTNETTGAHGIPDPTTLVVSSDVDNIVQLTQAAYDALDPPVTTTLYIVVG